MTRVLLTALSCAVLVGGVATPAIAAGATVDATVAAATNFDGMVALSNCSGSVIRWSTSVATDHALVLTNGHCFELMGAREVVVDQPSVRAVTLLASDGSPAGYVSTTTLLYATMWTTDVALYDLGVSYSQVATLYGVHPITLDNAAPSPRREPISIISGFWQLEYRCNLNGFAWRLKEDVYTWRNALRYADGDCQVIGGTSGSPVLNATRVQVGINNTLNEDGEHCTLNNPCEKNRRGVVSVHRYRGYGQETWQFYTCLSANQLDLARTGCKLPKP